MLEPFIKELKAHKYLSESFSYASSMAIFNGSCSNDEIKEFLLLLSEYGETVEEIVGFVKALREKCLKIDLPSKAIDTCGTGGSGLENRFNVSTATAFILASSDVPVIKHGNKGSKYANGSFDFLTALKIPFDFTPNQIKEIFQKTNLCFLFARNFHLAMKYVAPARKEIKSKTIFNYIGPLANPAMVDYQIIGTVSELLAEKLTKAVFQLGTKKTLIIAGKSIDELSLDQPAVIFEITPKNINRFVFDPTKFIKGLSMDSVFHGNVEENANLFVNLLETGDIAHPNSRLLALNAGLGFYCFEQVDSISAGYDYALNLIRDKKVYHKFREYENQSLEESLRTPGVHMDI